MDDCYTDEKLDAIIKEDNANGRREITVKHGPECTLISSNHLTVSVSAPLISDFYSIGLYVAHNVIENHKDVEVSFVCKQ